MTHFKQIYFYAVAKTPIGVFRFEKFSQMKFILVNS